MCMLFCLFLHITFFNGLLYVRETHKKKKPNSSTHSPLQVLFRGKEGRRGADSRILLISHHKRIWEIALKMTGDDFFHSHTPLWHNPQLRELLSIPGVEIWPSKGILYLHQVITPLGVRNFQSLKDETQFADSSQTRKLYPW